MDNILRDPLDLLFERLVLLNGLLSLLKNQLDNLESSFSQSLTQQSIEVSKIIAAFALPIRDVSPLHPEQNFRGWFSIGHFKVEGEDYFQGSQDLLSAFSSWTVSQSYEASVTYLKDLLSHYFFYHREDASQAILEEPPAEGACLDDWKTYFRKDGFTPVSLMKIIRRLNPRFPRLERDNLRNINLAHWYRVLAEVRHGIVHSRLLIKNQRIVSWGRAKLDILHDYYSGTMREKDYHLSIVESDAKQSLEILAEYCYAIFGCLSELKNYEWDYSKS